MHPQSPSWTIGGTVLNESDELVVLGVTFDSKMTFEKHLRSVSRAASKRLGILRKSWQVLHDRLLLGRCFWDFVLPVLWLHIGTLMRLLAAEPRCTGIILFPCHYLCGTIMVTPYSMVWDWRVSRAGPMPFYWPSCSLPFCLLLFFVSLVSFYGLALCGYGLRTDRLLIALSQPYNAYLFP